VGPQPPGIVHAFIEITPFDLIKYEVDKATGYLRVGALSAQGRHGDGDPLDICVLSERPISRSEVVMNARVVGGILMVDRDEADGKIIGILENDALWGNVKDIADLPDILVERLRHYFATYKLIPGATSQVSIESVHGAEHAHAVVRAAMEDYEEVYGG
jgi:inorganic pyrophosphatase